MGRPVSATEEKIIPCNELLIRYNELIIRYNWSAGVDFAGADTSTSLLYW